MTQVFNKNQFLKIRRKLRSEMTKSETVLWKYIKCEQLGYRFRRQYGIGDYIVDFYCPQLRLVIEVDGLSHADENVFNKDIKKQKFLESKNIKVKRYSSEDVFKKLKFVLEDICQICELLAKTTPPTPS